MNREIVFLFSGQGSQYYQMGRGLYEQNRTFRSWMDRMDIQVQDLLGDSVVRVLYGRQGKGETFDDVRLTHPAIFMVEYALARTVSESGVQPSYTLGASLGVLAALAASGRLSAEEALGLVVRQALVIDEHCPRGGMIAVLAEPAVYHASPFLQSRSVIAGQNFASHFVLSAPEANLPAVEAFLTRTGVMHQRLPILYPFHSPWIDPIRGKLIEALGEWSLRDGAVPVVCCALGEAISEVSPEYFWMVAREEIAFMRAMAWLEELGPFDYLDLGPSGTLHTFLQYQLPKESRSRNLRAMTPFARDTELLTSVIETIKSSNRRVAV